MEKYLNTKLHNLFVNNEDLVNELLRYKYIKSEKVKRAFLSVDRKNFVPDNLKKNAYYDEPLPIGYSQTISAPSMVAIMLELLDVKEDNRVLEIGTGSGYNACLLASLSNKVYTIERIPGLRDFAKKNLEKCPFRDKIVLLLGDGSVGYENRAPYDRIIVTCGAPDIPIPLIEQLKDGGTMLIPLGGTFFQELYVVEKRGKEIKKWVWGDVAFVPLVGKYGHRWV